MQITIAIASNEKRLIRSAEGGEDSEEEDSEEGDSEPSSSWSNAGKFGSGIDKGGRARSLGLILDMVETSGLDV